MAVARVRVSTREGPGTVPGKGPTPRRLLVLSLLLVAVNAHGQSFVQNLHCFGPSLQCRIWLMQCWVQTQPCVTWPVSPGPCFWSQLFPERDTPFHAFIFFVLLFQAKSCLSPRNQLQDSILSVPPLEFHSPSPQAGINRSTS